MLIHSIDPVFDENSKVLILGSFPSVKSREEGFFYGHKHNRFWRVVAAVFNSSIPQTVEEKKNFLLTFGVAVWDVIKECDIIGSSDSTVKNVIPNDVLPILKKSKIEKIFTNGKTAHKFYTKFIQKQTGISAVCLPSTSPANAAYPVEKLIEIWTQIRV